MFNDNDEDENMCVVLDPIWRATVLEWINRNDVNWDVKTVYIDCSEELQEERLEKRWDVIWEIKKRKKDLKWFHPTPNCLIISANTSTSTFADIIENM